MIDGLIKKIKSVLLRDSNTFTPCTEYVLQPSGEFISHQRATISHILAAKRKHEDPDMQMAEVIGIGQTTYSGWEREARVPRRKEHDKILAALKKLKVNVDTYLCQSTSI